ANITGINTSSWLSDDYNLNAYLVNSSDSYNLSEPFIFKNVSVSSRVLDWMCNQTTEQYNVTINNHFTDAIQYNVSLEIPAGWSSSPAYQLVNTTAPGNYTLSFNLTSSSSAAEIVYVNATVAYTYPVSEKTRNSTSMINESNSISILEITRETPSNIGTDTVFDSQLTIYNKGCAASSGSTIIKETISTGWTPANPSIMTNEYGSDIELISATTDLINNIVTWELGTIPVNKYAVLIYQVKSPVGTSQVGSLYYNTTWDSKNFVEYDTHPVRTFNYTEESHLEFNIEAIQQPAYPWVEPRSAQVNVSYNYSLKVTNIGDNATGSDWNVTLDIPEECNITQVYDSGTWNDTTRKITWQLSDIGSYASS
ncbi:MAG: hypothetical protein KAR23_05240, partial [Candidatus Aenigmarchaeota archaeon]|nr:hypothetical protein [Candidatus Aenigmarchaeota archaeon]